MEVCSQFVEQGHIFLERVEKDFHHVIFDEFEKMHTDTEYADDIGDTLSEGIIWWCERNRLGIPCPEDMYNHTLLKKTSVRARAPFSCLNVCD